MKKIITTLILATLCLMSTVSLAQRTKLIVSPTDTSFYVQSRRSNYTYHGVEAIQKDRTYNKSTKWKWHSGYFSGINLFYNGLAGTISPKSNSFMQLSNKSIGVDINLFDYVIYSHNFFGIVSGVGLESNNFRFQKNVSITTDASGVTVGDYSWEEKGISLSKSKLNTTYLNIPLLFQFRFPSGLSQAKGWMSIGVVGGLRLQSYTKVKNPQIGKVKNFSNFNLRNFHYGVLFSLGYNHFSINAKYYPHSMFIKNFGPHLEQFNIGVGLTF